MTQKNLRSNGTNICKQIKKLENTKINKSSKKNDVNNSDMHDKNADEKSNTSSIFFNADLANSDAQISDLIEKEVENQKQFIGLIASENHAHPLVLRTLQNPLQNRYSEGKIGQRFYGNLENIDRIEQLAIDRALDLFRLNRNQWDVIVQCHSGSQANFVAYCGILNRNDRVLSLALSHGGHLSHGSKPSKSSEFFEFENYCVNINNNSNSTSNNLIDYDELEAKAMQFKPKLIIAGVSAYSRDLDYRRFKEICRKCGDAYLLCDISHISGLIAGKLYNNNIDHDDNNNNNSISNKIDCDDSKKNDNKNSNNNAFDYADIVTTTTHKTLRGPRSAMIFVRKDVKVRFENNANNDNSNNNNSNTNITNALKKDEFILDKIRRAHFPGLSGGPNNSIIAALAVALKLANTREFSEYSKKVIENAQTMAKCFIDNGFHVLTGGTDCHMFLLDVSSCPKKCEIINNIQKKYSLLPSASIDDDINNNNNSNDEINKELEISQKLNGNFVEKLCTKCCISINRNSLPDDKSFFQAKGLRIGSSQITTRSFDTSSSYRLAELLIAIIYLANEILVYMEKTLGLDQKNLAKNFNDTIDNYNNKEFLNKIQLLRREVLKLSNAHPLWY